MIPHQKASNWVSNEDSESRDANTHANAGSNLTHILRQGNYYCRWDGHKAPGEKSIEDGKNNQPTRPMNAHPSER